MLLSPFGLDTPSLRLRESNATLHSEKFNIDRDIPHILNIASLTGFAWSEAPLKWQVLDVVYLLLDVVVGVGLLRGAWIGVVAFYLAALSQIALYTVFRHWVLNVPEAFQRSAEDLAYLDWLVVFHVVTCLAMGMATMVGRQGLTPQHEISH